LAGAEGHRSGGSAVEQEVRCGGAIGSGARGSTAQRGLGLGFPGVRVPLFVGRRNDLGVWAGRGGSPGFSGGRCASGKKRRRGKKMMCGPWLAEGERERGESTRAGVRGRLGRVWPTWGEGGRGEREEGDGPRVKKSRPKREEGKGQAGLLLLFLFSPLFFPFLN
jgi:hypothetical protein